MKNAAAVLIAGCIASATFVGWRVHSMKSHTVNHFEVVQDPSLSFTGGCQSLIGSAEEALRNPSASAESTLTVLVLGDASTAYEPGRLAAYSVPTSRRVIEGRGASVTRREGLLQDLRARCSSLRPTLITPIYLGVKQAIADLRANGCNAVSDCGLWVSTDLEENTDRSIEEKINGGHGARKPLPLPLDNAGIKVTFCGFAETAGRFVGPSGSEAGTAGIRGSEQDDRLRSVWRSLFASPGLVSFRPYCPNPSILRTHEATGPGALPRGNQ